MKEYARMIVTTTFHIMPAVSTEARGSVSFARAKDLQEHCWLYLKPAQIGSHTTAIEPVDTRDGHLGPASPLDVRKATFDDVGKVASANGETLDFEPEHNGTYRHTPIRQESRKNTERFKTEPMMPESIEL
jgi:hypothetical protein